MPPIQPKGIITSYELAYVEKNPAGNAVMGVSIGTNRPLEILSCSMIKPTKFPVRPAKTPIRLGIFPV